ncbi:hypothetical protein PAL_GLEAN10025856 [Pteropus alecto]|uniref:Uncharacterized protein n=1 Tax=Pteropus alecto TaxID=9402 RepID=L5JZ55_PTEAL|nr:hypothetical protein PAL_GLEAN10025856 [Pteropus alecto]
MFSGPPSPSWEKMEDRGEVEPVQIFLEMLFQADTQSMGQRDSYTRWYHLHVETSPPFSGHCPLTMVEVLPTVPGLVLVGEAAVKRGSLVVLDFGLDVFCMLLTPKDITEATCSSMFG